MTYCVAIKLNAGLVFLSDSRTNAGIDHVSTFRKTTVFEKPGERVLVLLTAGNLAATQSVCSLLNDDVQRGSEQCQPDSQPTRGETPESKHARGNYQPRPQAQCCSLSRPPVPG